jgi:endonuclease/exonuclease/phosphatase family metal-dependent hydrolase
MMEFPTHFKICTFNLFNYVEPPFAYYEHENIYSESQWAKKQHWMFKKLLEVSPDIVGFQEVFSPESLKKLTQKLGYTHFVTVSEPRIDSYHVFDKPVVALASRFPIVSATQVVPDSETIEKLGLQADFAFSRPPIRAEIHINGLGTLLVYVVHLKSKRADWRFDTAPEDMGNVLLARQMGSWLSSIQRGTEAALIYQDIVKQAELRERLVVVMGDFNDSIDATPLQPLIGSSKLDRLNGRYIADMSAQERREFKKFCLFDAYDLQYPRPAERKATHFMGHIGNVLDYILLSNHFCADHDHSLATVSKYHVEDSHLVDCQPESDAECSDHALVWVNIHIRR